MDSPPRLRVGIMSAGRVGAVLGAALRTAGHTITGVVAVSDLSRLRADALLPGIPVLPPDQVIKNSELVLFAVPDDALPSIISGCAEAGLFNPGQFLAHTSGGYGVSVFAPAAGTFHLALHPVMTFTGTSVDLARLVDTPFGVTAGEGMRPVGEALVVEMGGDPVWVPESARGAYHASLALSANYLNTLVNESVSILGDLGMENPQRLLAPLLSASLDNALRLGDRGLTGPIARGDSTSVERHLAVLADRPATKAAYQALGRLATDRALAAGLLTVDQAADLLIELGEDRT